ncbi:hypothetical protein [Ferdinandcohnia sp. Marseille-Q9671]
MTAIGTLILPIIILLILAVVLISIILGKKHKGVKSTKILLGVYFSILVASVIVYYLLPEEKFVSDTPNEHNHVKVNFEEIHNASRTGQFTDVEGVNEKNTWNLTYLENELDVSFLEDTNGMHTFFERKESMDETIEITYYVANTIIQGIDFFHQVPIPVISIEGDRLIVSNNGPQEVKFSSFHNEFVISQFKGGGLEQQFDDHFDEEFGPRGYQILHVKIPKNLELTGSEFIEYVEK